MRFAILSSLLIASWALSQVDATRSVRSVRSVVTPASSSPSPSTSTSPASASASASAYSSSFVPISSMSYVLDPASPDSLESWIPDWSGLQFAFETLPVSSAAPSHAYTYTLTVHPLNKTITTATSPVVMPASLLAESINEFDCQPDHFHTERHSDAAEAGNGPQRGVERLWFTVQAMQAATGTPAADAASAETVFDARGRWSLELPCDIKMTKSEESAATRVARSVPRRTRNLHPVRTPVAIAPSASIATIDSADNNGDFGISAPGDRTDYQLKDYGWQYGQNKNAVYNAIQANGLDWSAARAAMAIAMLETGDMGAWSHDSSKDWDGDSKNVSLFNMNVGFLKYIGSGYAGNPDALNGPDSLSAAVAQLYMGMNNLGMDGFLNFHRGGQTAFQDGTSYGAYDYRNTISSMIQAIANDESLLTDQRRIEISLGGV